MKIVLSLVLALMLPNFASAADAATAMAVATTADSATKAVTPRNYQVDLSHTSVYFGLAHFGRSQMRARFNQIKFDQLQFDTKTQSGYVDLQIDPDSVDTGSRLLDGVIRSPQFLDTKEHQFIRFQSSRFIFDAQQLLAIEGQLTLLGRSQPVRLQARRFVCGEVSIAIFKRQVCGGDFHTSFLRSQFGMKHLIPDVGDEIEVQIAIEAIPTVP